MAGVGTNAEKDDIFDASKYVNDPTIELLWSKQAIDHMETHYNLITSIPPQQLKLSPHDDRIYDAFIGQFPSFKLDKLEIESLKSEEKANRFLILTFQFISSIYYFPNFKLDKLEIESEESKRKWRKFSEEFVSIVDDATFGTLVRIDSSKEYNEENTILVLHAPVSSNRNCKKPTWIK
ncbi:protein PBDC1 [Caerostris extrusa]|uniref:Protein PBDC1 n=1 Tax=Caerostris extrusa TaxID=172846 RepID=A0AAV4U7Y4_CAEEX|nr:protein PBDC1 [Caerostris extrusa]